MNGTDLESSGRLASLTWSPPVACEWLWRGNERYETEGMHTQSLAQVNVEPAGHLSLAPDEEVRAEARRERHCDRCVW